MKTLLGLFTAGIICLSGGGCGSTDRPPRVTTNASATKTEQTYSNADADNDNDIGAPNDDTNNNSVLDVGHPASATDRQAVTTLIKHYYAIAIAGDGSRACAMLTANLAEAVAEDYGHGSAGPVYLSGGTTCPTVMKLLFEHDHAALLSAVPALRVTRVRLSGRNGLAIIGFGAVERQVSVAREGRTWKVAALLDSELP
jgi:hypothetical protein